MSNKPKNVKRLVKYEKTPGENYHDNLVLNAINWLRKRFGFSKHVGSKPEHVIRQYRNRDESM